MMFRISSKAPHLNARPLGRLGPAPRCRHADFPLGLCGLAAASASEVRRKCLGFASGSWASASGAEESGSQESLWCLCDLRRLLNRTAAKVSGGSVAVCLSYPSGEGKGGWDRSRRRTTERGWWRPQSGGRVAEPSSCGRVWIPGRRGERSAKAALQTAFRRVRASTPLAESAGRRVSKFPVTSRR